MKRIIIISLFILFCCLTNIFKIHAESWQNYSDSARSSSEKQDFENALKFAKLALNQAQMEFKDLDTNSRKTLNFIGETFYYLGNLDSAEYYFRQGIAEDKKISKSENLDQANLYLNLAVVLDDQGKTKEAESYYYECLEINKKLFKGDSPEVANCLNSLAVCLKSQGKLADAEPIYRDALEMNRRLYKIDNPNLATSICNVANFYNLQGKYPLAEALYKEALDMRKRLYKKDHPELANSLSNLAVFYLNQSKFPEAESYCRDALEMIQRLFQKDHPSIATMINNLAKIYYNLGKYSYASEYYKKSIEMRQRLYKGDHPDIATDMNNLAMLYKDQGKLKEAEPFFLKSLAMYQKLYKSDHQNIANCLDNIAALFLSEGRFNEAETYSNQSLEMTTRLFPGDNPALAMRINNHAMIHEAIGHFHQADSLFNTAIEMNNRIYKSENQFILLNYINLGNMYFNQKKYNKADTLYKKASVIANKIFKDDHPYLSSCLNNLAKIQFNKGNFKQAEEYYLKSLEMQRRLYNGNHPSIAETMINLAKLYEVQNKNESAEKYYLQSLNMFKDFYSKNSANLSEKEKEQFWNSIKNHFEFFYSFVSKQANKNPQLVQNLYDFLLFSKGLLLSSVIKIKNRILNSADTELQNKFRHWQSQKEYLAYLYKFTNAELNERNINRDSIENYTNSLEKDLSQNSELFSNEFDKSYLNWIDIKKSLNKNETIVELVRYHNSKNGKLTNKISYLCLILSGNESSQPILVQLSNGNYLDSTGYLIYKEFNGNNLEDISESKRKGFTKEYESLYSSYWKPIQSKIAKGNKIFLSPDGIFNQINLQTLINPISKKYLIEEVNLHQITSSRDIVNNKESNNLNSNSTAVLVGFPNFTLKIKNNFNIDLNRSSINFKQNSKPDKERGYSIEQLPGTKIEVENINELLKNSSVRTNLLIGDNALEDSLKVLSNPSILHIATHGFFITENENLLLSESDNFNALGTDLKKSQENPLLRSGLLLTGAVEGLNEENHSDNSNDGILTAFEAQNLNLDNTELVVLSACETGKGELRNGEGVYGLQRAFQVAGAKNLIMSLWKVDDQATQLMMTNFYQNWLKSRNLNESFKTAQQTIRNKFNKPYYWGAFILVGNN